METSANVDDAATAMQTTTFQVSMLRCRMTGRVLFLEAGKDFVDTLFRFLLEVPVGTIMHMLASAVPHAAGVGVKGLEGISSLFGSVKQLDGSHLHVDKQHLLQPKPAVTGMCSSIGLIQFLDAAKLKSCDFVLPEMYYRCKNVDCYKLSSTEGSPCNDCRRRYYNSSSSFAGQVYSVIPGDLKKKKEEIVGKLLEDSSKVGARSTGQGFVTDITYMITDQLEILPSVTVGDIGVLNKLKVSALSDLESSDVTVNITQVLQLLQSSVTSSTCLNDVFGEK